MGHRVTTLNVNTIEPAGNTLTIGASGDSVVLADDVKANTYKDAGGNTLFTSNGSGVLSSVNSGFGDALVLIQTQTASSSASISFTSGIDSTYKEYIFRYINIHPGTSAPEFSFQVSSNGGSSYGLTTTSTYFRAYHTQNGSTSSLSYTSGRDVNGTGFIPMGFDLGMGNNDESASGELHLFNPSSSFAKNYYGRISMQQDSNAAFDGYVGGYINTTAAINAVQFKMSSGNIDAGKIKMYGVI
jgi:hypothetical protein